MTLIIQVALIIALLVLQAYLAALLFECYRISRGDVPFVPSSTSLLRAVADAGVLPREGVILDLGCGDGKALRALARAGYRGPLIGYERAILPWLHSKFLGFYSRTPVEIRHEPFNRAPLEEARGVYLFLLTSVLADIAPMLKARLRPGTVVVSSEFEIKDWLPVRVITARGVTSKEAKVFVYRA